ncbi:related to heterokaryon incompatibility Het-C protein [Cephalotrichum gorgonifer]|uniref:Related to heterokaryon incompatibility Het-C protein n=1 Tax=Cephalotrichum gorgonifer TaxID=2041049 RepID=A0AAE8N6E6_9PEZI|nr:related to heterokaryon incompatibility Het-C protein [Cephalotrichum gorgonifer]
MAIFDLGQRSSWLLAFLFALVFLPSPAAAFGAGNIPSIAQVEGHNWRHGDIEDILATIAFIHGKKWTSMLIKRTYFGNWLRDYSQAIDVGSLKGPVNADTIRILIWVLSFMAFGYATEEFEVTADRLGVYRPEEHIDNPLGYGENQDARKFDPRLRGPVRPIETEIDMRTGMKNYIANESGDWATSAGYLRFSFARCIHYGRLYTSGSGKGKTEDLCEALRCLGQALHCMEDFGAHTNYCELALIEMGHREVFAHVGTSTEINVRGKRIWPLVTGTFGAVDFLHSVIGEATDHFTQSEVDEVDIALKNAEKGGGDSSSRGFGSSGGGGADFISLISKLPGVGGDFASEAQSLRAASEAQERENDRSTTRDNVNVIPGMSPNFDPVKTASRIYPILEFRDKIVKAISAGISKIPGLEKLLDHIGETLTAFVLGLLAPFIRPIIQQCSKVLKDGSSTVVTASANSQYEPWNNPRCSDPTHSMISKDHFTNILNSCGGRVAATILQYTVPRVLFAWEHPNVPVDEVVNDALRAFHHPALRDESIEIQRDMFNTVRLWYQEHPRRSEIPHLLSSQSVRRGDNHVLHGKPAGSRGVGGHSCHDGGHGKTAGGLWGQVKTRDLWDAEESGGPSPAFPPSQTSYGYQNEGGSSQGYGPHSGGEAASFYGGSSSSYGRPGTQGGEGIRIGPHPGTGDQGRKGGTRGLVRHRPDMEGRRHRGDTRDPAGLRPDTGGRSKGDTQGPVAISSRHKTTLLKDTNNPLRRAISSPPRTAINNHPRRDISHRLPRGTNSLRHRGMDTSSRLPTGDTRDNRHLRKGGTRDNRRLRKGIARGLSRRTVDRATRRSSLRTGGIPSTGNA